MRTNLHTAVLLYMSVAVACWSCTSNSAVTNYEHIRRAMDEKVTEVTRKFFQSQDVIIDFYGKIVDQNTNPVTDASVTVEVLHYSADPKELFSGTETMEVKSSADGCFDVHDAVGRRLFVAQIRKEGCEFVLADNTNRGFDYTPGNLNIHMPNAAKPVVFVMRKLGDTTLLLERDSVLAVTADNRYVTAELFGLTSHDLAKGRTTASTSWPGTRLRVQQDAGTGDWIWSFSGKNPGDEVILLSNRVYSAPAAGYSGEATLRLSGEIRNPIVNAFLCLRSANPEMYSILALRLSYTSRDQDMWRVRISSITNPYGDRCLDEEPGLEPYFQRTKALKQQARDALADGRLPAKIDAKKIAGEERAKAGQ